MSEDTLRDLLSRDLSDEDAARVLLDLTLQAAPPGVADAVRVCALPAWFDAELLALLAEKDEKEAADLLEQVATFSFVLPREDGGYVYHEATRDRLLDWWGERDHHQRFKELNDCLADRTLGLAWEQRRRLRSPGYLDALAVLDAAYPNILAAWERVVELGSWKLARDFAYALHDYFRRRGLWNEWIARTEAALSVCSKREGDARSYAGLQTNLGNAYAELPTGDRTENLQKAIACYHEALGVFTPEAAPLDYARVQNNRGTAYTDFPTDRAANLKKAIECFAEALRFRTPEVVPLAYATTRNNQGIAYAQLPTEDRAENVQQAIECFSEALRFRTPEVAPLAYAVTQNNLGNAYADLPAGDRAENLEKAIECYREALRFRTLEATPFDYAMTQNNLGVAYVDLPIGDRAENVQQAIRCHREALRVYTPEVAPFAYASTQNALGYAYVYLPTGDRAENLEKAIEYFREARRFRTLDAVPLDYAMTENNLGMAYLYRPTEDRAANLQQALEHVEVALQVDGLLPWDQARFLFTRGLIHLARGHQKQALEDHRAAFDLADSITIADAQRDLNELATDYPDTPGLDAVRALFSSSQ